MENIAYIIIPAFLAGIIQGVTGFGAGIVMMMFLPALFGVTVGAGISSAICLALGLSMAYRYRRSINYRQVIPLAVLYVIISSLAIYFSLLVDQKLLKFIFGIFLVILAIYFLFFAKNAQLKITPSITLICISVSALCDGLFGIGGPLMVLYFLTATSSKEEYLGSLQMLFVISNACALVLRIIRSIITIPLLSSIILGMVSILLGLHIANKIVDSLNGARLKKIIYLLLAICGTVNIISFF